MGRNEVFRCRSLEMKTMIVPVVLYGAEKWSMGVAERLNVKESCLISMCKS